MSNSTDSKIGFGRDRTNRSCHRCCNFSRPSPRCRRPDDQGGTDCRRVEGFVPARQLIERGRRRFPTASNPRGSAARAERCRFFPRRDRGFDSGNVNAGRADVRTRSQTKSRRPRPFFDRRKGGSAGGGPCVTSVMRERLLRIADRFDALVTSGAGGTAWTAIASTDALSATPRSRRGSWQIAGMILGQRPGDDLAIRGRKRTQTACCRSSADWSTGRAFCR